MDAYRRSDRIAGWCIFGLLAVTLAVALAAGCTAEQLARTDRVAAATTQAAADPLVQVAASANPYTGLALALAGGLATYWWGKRNGRKVSVTVTAEPGPAASKTD